MAPLREAFADEFSDAEVDEWLTICEPDRWLGAFADPADASPVGAASAYTVRLTVPGGEVGAAAVTGVGTRPDFHRRGILRALMRRQLDDVRQGGEPVAVLWASEGAIYQRFGYGMAARDGFFEVATTRTRLHAAGAAGGPGAPHRGGGVPRARASPCTTPCALLTPGAISRSEPWWRSVLADPEYSRRGASHKYRVVYEADGQVEGYAIYRIRDDWDHRGPKSVLEVKEAVTDSPRALRELWRYLFEVDLVRTVKAFRVPVPNPLQHILLEPRAIGLVANDGLWVRLVDLPAALAGRRYATTDSLVLEVSDGFCPWNAGRWRIETDRRAVGGGGPGRAHGERARPGPRHDGPGFHLPGRHPADRAGRGRPHRRAHPRRPPPRRRALRRRPHALVCLDVLRHWELSMARLTGAEPWRRRSW